MKKIVIISLIALSFTACKDSENQSDAYGNFEAVDILVSAQAQGELTELNIEEGQKIAENTSVGKIDTTRITLQINQLKSQKIATGTQIVNIQAKIKVAEVQVQNLQTEINRLKNLVENGAAPSQKLDNLNQQMAVLKQNIQALQTQKNSVGAQIQVIEAQKKILENQLSKCNIINPINGTILKIYVRKGELAAPGKPIYKIADLSSLELKAYISGAQLPNVKLGNKVKVYIDKNQEENTELEGIVSWISSNAEFTPKIIQTKEERVNLVYAIKVKVPNKEGIIKIGMPGEIKFIK